MNPGKLPSPKVEELRQVVYNAEKPQLSIVLPVYKNSQVLAELYARINKVFEPLEIGFELLFVNDACPQGSLEVLRELANKDAQVAVLSLDQNTGQQRAILLGLAHCRGELIVVMDADLQDPPEAIPHLLAVLNRQYPVVFAGRRGRYESLGRLFTSRLYKSILHWLSGIPIDAGLFLAMRREVLEAVLSIQDSDPYLVAMIGCTGYPTTSIPVQREQRGHGRSAYTSWGRIKAGFGAVRWVLAWKMGRKPAGKASSVATIRIGEFIGKRFSNS